MVSLMVENGLSSPVQQAAFLAASSQHSGDWLFALPIASCGLRLDNEAVRIATGVRLGSQLCIPHRCHCGAQVDAHDRHSFICKRAPGRTIRHHHLNELIARALSAASIPNTKEPQGLSRSDGKRPDGLTLVPWQSGKPLVWNVTVICPLADSYSLGGPGTIFYSEDGSIEQNCQLCWAHSRLPLPADDDDRAMTC